MANVRVTESSFVNRMKNIVAIPDHYVALPAQIAATNAVTEDGKKIIKAGTCVTNASSLTGRQTGLTPCAEGTMTFDGVIFNDVEVLTGETIDRNSEFFAREGQGNFKNVIANDDLMNKINDILKGEK